MGRQAHLIFKPLAIVFHLGVEPVVVDSESIQDLALVTLTTLCEGERVLVLIGQIRQVWASSADLDLVKLARVDFRLCHVEIGLSCGVCHRRLADD